MGHEPSRPSQDGLPIQLAMALGDIRDSLVMVSCALKDVISEMPSTARDEVIADVERYLCRLKEASRNSLD